MDPNRERRVLELFNRSCDLGTDDRRTFLMDECGSDVELMAEVEQLISADARDGDALADDRAGEAVAEALARPADWTPEHIGPYRIVRRIGSGGMGAVFEALQEAPHRRVALKLVPPMMSSPERVKRFQKEVEVLGRLQHPGIAEIFDAGTYDLGEGPQPFFAMELVEGVDVRTYARREGLDDRAILALVAEVADAVQHAHERGVVHRDLKPENVMVVEIGGRRVAKVLDFGVARATGTTAATSVATRTGQLIGTLAYMAPEQISGHAPIAPSTDVYALGAVLFELLTGRLPHPVEADPTPLVLRRIAEDDAPPLGRLAPRLAGDVETIVGRALEKDPHRRYPTASALAADLRRHLDDLPIAARPPSRTYRARKFARRNKPLVGGVLATFLALTAGLVVALLQAGRQRDLREAADRQTELALGHAYRSDLAAAWSAIAAGEPQAAHAHLDAAAMYAESGFELDFLRASLEQHERALEGALRPAGCEHCGPALALTASGHVAAVLDDGRLAAWDPARGARTATADGSFLAVARSDGETHVVAAAADGLYAWDPDGREAPHRFHPLAPGDPAHLVVAPGGRTLYASGRVLEEDERGEWSEVARLPDAHHARFLEGDRELLLFGEGGRPDRGVLRFDVRTGERLAERGHNHNALARSLRGSGLAASDLSRNVWLLNGDLTDRARLVGHTERNVRGLAFSPDGRLLASSDAKTLRVWDAETGAPLSVRAHAGADAGDLWGLTFTPDGARIVGVKGSRAWVWAADARGAFSPLARAGAHVYHAALSPDGERVAYRAATRDRPLLVCDARSGQEVARMEESNRWRPLAFSADGGELLLGLRGDGTAFVDLATGAARFETAADGPLARWRAVPNELGLAAVQPGTSLAVSADGWIAYLDDLDLTGLSEQVRYGAEHGSVELVDPDGARRSFLTEDDQFWSVAFHPTASALACGLESGTIRLYDRGSGALRVATAAQGGAVYGLAFSPDGRRLASAGEDGFVTLWDPEELAAGPLLRVRVHDQYAFRLAWSRDGTRLLSAGGDGALHLLDARSRAQRPSGVRTSAAGSLESPVPSAPSPEELRSAGPATLAEGNVRLALSYASLSPDAGGDWGAAGHALPRPIDTPGRPTWIRPLDDGRVLAVVARRLRIWDLDEGGFALPFPDLELADYAVSRVCGERVAVWSKSEREVAVLDLARRRRVGGHGRHDETTIRIDGDRTGRRFASSSTDRVVVWDEGAGVVYEAPSDGAAAVIALHPDGQRLVQASRRTEIRALDVATGRELARRSLPHPSHDLVHSPDGRWLAVNLARGAILLDAETLETRRVLAGPARGFVDFYPDGSRLTFTTGYTDLDGIFRAAESRVLDTETGETLLSVRGVRLGPGPDPGRVIATDPGFGVLALR